MPVGVVEALEVVDVDEQQGQRIAVLQRIAGVEAQPLLEAVACFLALLEMLKRGEATVEQGDAFGPITVTGSG